MVERYREAWIQLTDGSFWTADVPESTIDEMRYIAEKEGGGFFSGRVYFRNARAFEENQRVKMKDLLVVEVEGQRGV